MILKSINITEGYLTEVDRKSLIRRSRHDSKDRYRRRLKYEVSNFRGVDLKELFENDYFVFTTPINGYEVTVAFPGVFTMLKKVIKSTSGDPTKINLQMVIRAMARAFDATDDVKVRCTCSDFKYRFMYWAWKNEYLYGDPDPGTEEFPEKTNPDDKLGATCKHLNLLLSNKRWLTKAASVVNAFIKAYPEKAAHYLYDEDEINLPDDIDKPEDKEYKKPELRTVKIDPSRIK
jgi:hypothetical protein